MNILAIDTATNVMGVALTKDGILKGELVTNLQKNHSIRLMPAIDFLMDEINMNPEDLDQIIVSKGPGSYTGIRIGLSTAKAMAWALDVPIIGVSSLEQLAFQGRNSSMLISPFIDARRDSVFTGLYHFQGGELTLVVEEQHVKMSDWLKLLEKQREHILFVSPDISLYKEEINRALGDFAIMLGNSYQIGKPSDLIEIGKYKEEDEIHTLVPNYLRLTEAEANLIKTEKGNRKNE